MENKEKNEVKVDVNLDETVSVEDTIIEPEVMPKDEESSEDSDRPSYKMIQEEISKLQSNQRKRKDKGSILNDVSMNQLETEVKDLFDQAERIRKATDVQGNGETFFEKASKLIPYFGKKMKDKVDETMFESSSLQDSIDKFMDSMTKSRERANEYLSQITERQNALEESLEAGQNIEKVVSVEMQRLQEKNENAKKDTSVTFTSDDKREFNNWLLLFTNLQGINQANQFALQQTEKAQMTTYGMTQNINNLQPILKSVLETQGEIAGQNVMNKLMIETIDVGKKLVNQIQIQNQRDSNHLLEKTVKIATDPMIEKETLKQLNIGLKDGEKKLQLVMKEQANKIREYNKTVAENNKALLKHKGSDLLVDFDLPEIDYKEESKETSK